MSDPIDIQKAVSIGEDVQMIAKRLLENPDPELIAKANALARGLMTIRKQQAGQDPGLHEIQKWEPIAPDETARRLLSECEALLRTIKG